MSPTDPRRRHVSDERKPAPMRIGPREFVWGQRTYIMGIVNVSPDSFSGDGIADPEEAVAYGKRLVAEGADLLDVGGQSTRPGFEEITAGEEIRRVAPVIARLVREVDVPVAVDTYKPEVAAAALDAGAHLVNDIHGFRLHPEMAQVVATAGVPAIVMHNQRGRPFHDVVEDVQAGLEETFVIAREADIRRDRLIIDPGFGFGWTEEQNLELLRRLGEFRAFGRPILVGTSRKSTIGAALGGKPVGERVLGTAASCAIAIANGADIIRVHDVREMAEVARVTDAIVRGWRG
ncbi:MAG TPA: dihydropteroate synthase [Dehalococcoidia bacterium]|nr:dihydropteroate synthase [Dehalococcoidia bacterium]